MKSKKIMIIHLLALALLLSACSPKNDNKPEMMNNYSAAGKKFSNLFPREGTHYVIFGHIGDCHVHFNFITANTDPISIKNTKIIVIVLFFFFFKDEF